MCIFISIYVVYVQERGREANQFVSSITLQMHTEKNKKSITYVTIFLINVGIAAFQAVEPGSIPGQRVFFSFVTELTLSSVMASCAPVPNEGALLFFSYYISFYL